MKDARRNKAKEMAEEFREKHFSECNKTHCLGWDYERVYLQGWTDADSHPDTSDGDEDELISEAELSECERLEKASTRVVGWYPRPHEKVIKGPFNRWFSIESTKNPIHVKDTASEEEDILFVANAMNMHSRLLAEIRRLRARKSQAAEVAKARELLQRAYNYFKYVPVYGGFSNLDEACELWLKEYAALKQTPAEEGEVKK